METLVYKLKYRKTFKTKKKFVINCKKLNQTMII